MRLIRPAIWIVQKIVCSVIKAIFSAGIPYWKIWNRRSNLIVLFLSGIVDDLSCLIDGRELD